MNRAGRLVTVKVVFVAVHIYLMIVLDLPKLEFFGKVKRRQIRGVVYCNRVQRPLQYGGLGIHTVELQGWALHIFFVFD